MTIGANKRSRIEPMSVQPATRASEAAAPVLLRERDGAIAILVLNRPAARNSLSEALLDALSAAFDRDRRRQVDPRGGAGGQRPGVLRRPRPEGIDGAPRRRRRRPRLFQAHHDHVQRDDAANRQSAAAGDRRGAGRRQRRRLPTGGELRPRRRLLGRQVRHARRRYRLVLLDPDGGAVAQCGAQSTPWKCCSPATWSRPKTPRASG